jgi:serine/threonine protein kinase
MAYAFTGQQVQKLYGQKINIRNIATNANDTINIQNKNVFPARRGIEGYGLRALHRHKQRGDVDAFLKVFQKDIPQRHQRSEFLVKLGLAKHHEWIFQGVPYACFNRQQVNSVEIVGHLTKFIGLQYGRPAEDLVVLKDEGQFDAYTQDERRAFAAHLASAVCALERVQLVHGDLSGGNVMIGPGPGGRNICCLCDFDGFFHPSQPMLPRKFEGDLTRPLGSLGYQYPELMRRMAADKDDSNETITVETDRFALAVLICEMMIWNIKLSKTLGRPQLLDEGIIKSRRLSDIPDNIKSTFSAGFALLEKALQAGSCEYMPAPDDWLNCLGIQSVLPTPFKSAPQVLFFKRKSNGRKLYRQAVLNQRPTGNFDVIDPELGNIVFNRDNSNHVILAIGSGLPCALRRSGRQERLTKDARVALPILPGDLLRIGDWEIVFEESSQQK